MTWKEQLNQRLPSYMDRREVAAVQDFIQTEIIENLIADIPANAHAQICEARGKQFRPCLYCLKQQLTSKWL